MPEPVVAAIDCGTNSIRLLVARRERDRLIDLERRMLTVRLGEDVDRTGRLSEAAMARTFAACREYRAVIASLGAARTRFVATSATRDADNADPFRAGVNEILGVRPEVISGAEEAALSFQGATAGNTYAEPVLVFDIGGGSTEFVLGAGLPVQSFSVGLGCVRFTERYVRHDPMTAGEEAAVRAAAADQLDRVAAAVHLAAAASVVGLAGTVTTVTALALGLPRYDAEVIHGARIPVTDVHRVAAELVAATTAERKMLPVMHPGRADVVAVGAVILSEILYRVGADQMIASEHDILDGIAWSVADGLGARSADKV